MHAADIYDYAVIRVVPRVEREEFVNVGVILSCQTGNFLRAAIALDEARLRALDAGLDLATVRRHLDAIVAICEGAPGSGPIGHLPLRARFHWLTARRSGIIQTSPVHTGRCQHGEAALHGVMRRMVLPPGAA